MTNTLFPGREAYTGPTEGWFAMLHHNGDLVEYSHDVMERVNYVLRHKPQHEISIRLHNMMYVGDCPATAKLISLTENLESKKRSIEAKYRNKLAWAFIELRVNTISLNDYSPTRYSLVKIAKQVEIMNSLNSYRAKCFIVYGEILAYVREHIPDYAWDGKQLVFNPKVS